jgi:phosphate transport system substrate-binding protein
MVVVLLVPFALAWAAGLAAASPQMNSTGSSFAGVAIQQWVGQAATLDGLNINWQVSNSVQGLDDFAQNQMDFAASDIPYSSGQASSDPTVPYQYLPDVAGALAFMYNLTGNDGQQIRNLVLNYKTLEDIFSGRIEYWNNNEIAALQTPYVAADLPDTKILPIYRSDASGENYLFSTYLLQMDPSGFEAYQGAMDFGVGQPSATWPTLPGGVQAPPGYPGWTDGNFQGENGADNAADYVSAASSNGAITYVETAYAKEHDMPVASLMNASGNAVQPTSQDDAVALEKAILYADLTQNLENVFTNPLPTAYPISAYSYFVTPCSPSLAAAQGSSCAGNNSGSSSFPSQKGQALGQFVQFVACAGQQQMADLGYSPLPPNLVQEDFDAIGRLNGGQEPPPVSSATCKNPYVDGQTPLPGEPAVIGSATAPVVGAGTAPGKSTGPGPGSAGTAVGGSNNSGGGAGGQVGLGSTVSTTQIGGAAQLSAIQAADAAKKTRQVNAIRAQFSNADALATTAARLLGTTSAAGAIALWCTVLLVVLAAPVIGSLMWRRRRRRGAGGSPAHPRSVLAIQAGGKGNGP